MRRFLYSLAVALTLALTSTMFTACSWDDVPECCKTIKEAKVYASLYVNQAFVDAFDIYIQTVEGDSRMLSPSPSQVSIDGQQMSMYSLTIEGTGRQLPVSTRVYISYRAKDLEQIPDNRDFIVAAQSHCDVLYKDGRIENHCSQWHHACSVEECQHQSHSMVSNIPNQDVVNYLSWLNISFGELYAFIDHRGYAFTTTNTHWCGTPSGHH